MTTFEELGLAPELVQAVSDLGYEKPTDIQVESIPLLLAGQDVMGMAQTGTGKTAAFALPMIQQLDPDYAGVQALVLTPTRELAIQVAHAIHQYGEVIDAHVLPVYGGQSYSRQVNRLQRDTQVVVGTPGRTLDLIRQGLLKTNDIRYVVLDEADEMLKMGFIEDVEAILEATPKDRQTALFSATLSKPIRRLAGQYMHKPAEITIENETLTVAETEQRYHLISKGDKLPALALLLEAEAIQNVLIFTKTRQGAAEVAEQLIVRGYPAEALHGDLDQNVRETVLRRFRNGDIRILIGTDVVARGMDIPSVSHVINYDLPWKGEEYVHRIGRTGRAGRRGVAISLVTPDEQWSLRSIQEYTKQPITRLPLPTPEAVYYQRDVRFLDGLDEVMQNNGLDDERTLVQELIDAGHDPVTVAAAAVRLARTVETRRPIEAVREVEARKKPQHSRSSSSSGGFRKDRQREHGPEEGMVKMRIALGKTHGVRPKDIVGAIANEAGIPGKSIGAIDVKKNETIFDVQAEMVGKVLAKMQRSTLRGVSMNLSRVGK
jgi:ATP-dependent RNA helicase DeaD